MAGTTNEKVVVVVVWRVWGVLGYETVVEVRDFTLIKDSVEVHEVLSGHFNPFSSFEAYKMYDIGPF